MTNRRAAVWGALFAVVVFASGLATGILVDRWLMRTAQVEQAALPITRGMGMGMRGPGPERLTARLTQELSLTAEQRQKVRDILENRRGQVQRMQRDLRADARRRFQVEQAGLRDALRAVLTPEQQAKFDAMVKEGPGRMWPGAGRWRRDGPGPAAQTPDK